MPPKKIQMPKNRKPRPKPGQRPQRVRSAYDWVENIENLNEYAPGGYHPVMLGDEFQDGRYRVVHKLGHGSFSTVWLVVELDTWKYYALKILVAEVSEKSHEVAALQELAKGPATHPGRVYVQHIIDDFKIEGPNGIHQCIVTEIAGASVAWAKHETRTGKFKMDVARVIAAQVMHAVDYLHTCGVIHGDLHTGNILLQPPSLDGLSKEEVYDMIGKPVLEPLQTYDGRPNLPGTPPYSVGAACWHWVTCDHLTEAKIIIADFSEAYLEGTHIQSLNTPIHLLAPEAILEQKVGKPADMWTMGCTVYSILGWGTINRTLMVDKHDILAEMILLIGSLPQRLWDLWDERLLFFHEDGTINPDGERELRRLDNKLADRIKDMRGKDNDELGGDELAALERLFRDLLTHEPEDRLTAAGAVNSDWMRIWGRPALASSVSLGPKENLTSNEGKAMLQDGADEEEEMYSGWLSYLAPVTGAMSRLKAKLLLWWP